MKKFLIPVVAVAAMAIAPSLALATPPTPSPGQWQGYSTTPHCDNATATTPPYPTAPPGSGGAGDSHYYAGSPGGSPYPSNGCAGETDTTIYSTGYFDGNPAGIPVTSGTGHGANPGTYGGFYIGSSAPCIVDAAACTSGPIASNDGNSAGIGIKG
jgi:hypothetical protein